MRFFISAFVFLGCVGGLWSQGVNAEPSIAYVFPAGATRGAEVFVTVAGQRLKGTDLAWFSGLGVKARVVGVVGASGPLNKVQEEALKDYLQARNKGEAKTSVPDLPDYPALRDLAARSKDELRVVADLFVNRDKMAKAPMNELVTLALTIDPDAPVGNQELRLLTPLGPTNPIVFQVGALPEVAEAGPLQIPDPGRRVVEGGSNVLNGQILPNEVDVWKVPFRQGDRIMVACQARNLIPYIADAVPGWFQAWVAVRDPSGKEIAWNDDHGSDPDPVVQLTAPSDGVYSIEIRDAIDRGRFDFVYRLIVGSVAEVERQLPFPSLVGKPLSPRPLEAVLTTPGQKVFFPVAGKAGEGFRARVVARQVGSPLDAVLRLLDPKGRVVAVNDDDEDKTLGTLPHQADPRLVTTFPTDGSYQLELRDASGLGGADYQYRLIIDRPEPDFTMLTQRSGLGLPVGGTVSMSVTLQRRDGWQGEVEIVLAEAPSGFRLGGGLIPAGQESGVVTLSAPSTAKLGLASVKLQARGTVAGTPVTHELLPADLRMEAFGNTHLVPASQLLIQVIPKR